MALAFGAPARAEAPPAGALAEAQARVGERMAEVEQRLQELARLTAEQQPERSVRLAEAFALSRERFVVERMGQVRELLAAGRLAEAARVQQELLADLERLVAALGTSDIAEELARLEAAAAALEGLLERQAAAADAARQRAVRQDAAALHERMRGGPGADLLMQGIAGMGAAEQALKAGRQAAAAGAQREAADRIERALAEVRDAIARLTGRQRAALQTQLAELLDAMLEAQRSVRADTRAADDALRDSPRSRAARLALADLTRRQAELAERADEALALARRAEAAVLAVALEGLRSDVAACRDTLADGIAGPETQGLQDAVIAEIEGLLAALRPADGARADVPSPGAEQSRGNRRRGDSADLAADLRIVRAVQSFVAGRTAALDRLRGSPAAAPRSDAGARVAALADRQAGVTAMLAAVAGRAAAVGAIKGASTRAEGLLRNSATGEPTQGAQREVLDGLERLVAALAQKAQLTSSEPGEQGQRQVPGAGGTTAPPERPLDESVLTAGGPGMGPLGRRAAAAGAWLPELPEAERQEVADSFTTGRLPARYRDLLRDYGRRLAAEGGE